MTGYVTAAEADGYIAAEYLGSDPGRIAWEKLDGTQKEAKLMSACVKLDSLDFVGAASSPGQPLAWPRNGSDEVPPAIKHAQIEIALFPLREDTGDTKMRAQLRAGGVKSFSVGNLSESYDAGCGSPDFMGDPKIRGLLAKYLSGGHSTC